MRSTVPLAALALAAALAGPVPALAAEGSAPQPRLQAPGDEKPRPTDESLRDAMATLREIVAARLAGDAAEPLDEAGYVALATEIERQLSATRSAMAEVDFQVARVVERTRRTGPKCCFECTLAGPN